MAARAAMVTEADVARVFRAAKKEGVMVRLEIEPGRIVVSTTKEGAPTSNSFDEMFR